MFEVQGKYWYGFIVDIDNSGNKYQLVIVMLVSYLIVDVNFIWNYLIFIVFILLMFSLLLVWYFFWKIFNLLICFCQDVDFISNLYFEECEFEYFMIEEVDELYKLMLKMKLILKQFILMGNMLMVENNFFCQMQGLLSEIIEIVVMIGGIIFFVDK